MHCIPVKRSYRYWKDVFKSEEPALRNMPDRRSAATYMANKYGMAYATMLCYVGTHAGSLIPAKSWRAAKPVRSVEMVTQTKEAEDASPTYTAFDFKSLPTSALRRVVKQVQEIISNREEHLAKEVEALKRRCTEQGVDLRTLLG
jgi:hypothetical protein